MEHNLTFSQFISTVQDVQNYRVLKDNSLHNMLDLAVKFAKDARKHQRLIRALLWPVLWPNLLRGQKLKDKKLIKPVLVLMIELSKNQNNYETILELKKVERTYTLFKRDLVGGDRVEKKDIILEILDNLITYEDSEISNYTLHILKNFSGNDTALRKLRQKEIISKCMQLNFKEYGIESQLFLLQILCNACAFSKVRYQAMRSNFLKYVFEGLEQLDVDTVLLTLKIVRRLAYDIQNHQKLRSYDLNLRLLQCIHWLQEREKTSKSTAEQQKDIEFKRQISGTLMNLLKNRDNHTQFVNQFFIEAITYLARTGAQDTDFFATCALSHMSEQIKSHKTLVESNAIELMYEKLKAAQDIVIHRQGCRFFANLSFNFEFQKRMIKAQILSYLVQAIENHDRDTVKHSVIAIANLSSSEDFFNKLGKLPGIKSIIHLLDSSKDRDKDLLINASIALCNLTAYCNLIKLNQWIVYVIYLTLETNLHNVFVKQPEISTLKTAIQKSYQTLQHQDLTCILLKVICNLTKNRFTLYYLSKKGFLSLLFRILNRSHNKKFYANVVGAIADLTSRIDCQELFLKQRIMPVILQNFTLSSQNDQKIVAVALATLLLNGFSVQQQFIKHGGIQKLLYLIRKNDFLQKRLACKSFSLLSQDETNMRKLTQDECLTKIIRACFTYKHIDLITSRELIKLFINFIIFGQEQPQHMLKMVVCVCETCLLLKDQTINVLSLFTLNLLSQRIENHYIFQQSGILKLLDDLIAQIDLRDKNLFKQFTLSLLLNFSRNQKMHDTLIKENIFKIIYNLSFYVEQGLLCYSGTIIRKLLHSQWTTKHVKMQFVVDKLHEQCAHKVFLTIFRENFTWLFNETLVILKTTVKYYRRLVEYKPITPFLIKILIPNKLYLKGANQQSLNALYILAMLSYEQQLHNQLMEPQFQKFIIKEMYMNRDKGYDADESDFLDYYVPLTVIFSNLSQNPLFVKQMCVDECKIIQVEKKCVGFDQKIIKVKVEQDTTQSSQNELVYIGVDMMKIFNLTMDQNLLISQEVCRTLASVSFDVDFSPKQISNAVMQELFSIIINDDASKVSPLLLLSALVILHNCTTNKEFVKIFVQKFNLLELAQDLIPNLKTQLQKYIVLKIVSNLSINTQNGFVRQEVLQYCLQIIKSLKDFDKKVDNLKCAMSSVAMKIIIKAVVIDNEAITEELIDDVMNILDDLIDKVSDKQQLRQVFAQFLCLMAHYPKRAKKLMHLTKVSIFIITSMEEANLKLLKLSIRTFVKLCLIQDGQILDKIGDFNQLQQVIDRINSLPSQKERDQFLEHYLEVLAKIFRNQIIIEKINIRKNEQTILKIIRDTKNRQVQINAIQLLFTILHNISSVSKYEKQIMKSFFDLYKQSSSQQLQIKIIAIIVKSSVNFENHKRILKYGFFQQFIDRVKRNIGSSNSPSFQNPRFQQQNNSLILNTNLQSPNLCSLNRSNITNKTQLNLRSQYAIQFELKNQIQIYGLLNIALNYQNYEYIADSLKKLYTTLFSVESIELKYYIGILESTLNYLIEKKKNKQNKLIVAMRTPLIVLINHVSERVKREKDKNLYFCALLAQTFPDLPKNSLTWIWTKAKVFMIYIADQFQKNQTDELLDQPGEDQSYNFDLISALIKILYIFTDQNKFTNSCIRSQFDKVIQHVTNFLLVLLGQTSNKMQQYLIPCSEGLVLTIDYITQKYQYQQDFKISKRFENDILRLIQRTLHLQMESNREINANGLRCLSKIAHFDFVAKSPIIQNKTILENCILIFMLNQDIQQKLDQNICLVLDAFSQHDQHHESLADKSTFILQLLEKTIIEQKKEGFSVKLLSVVFRIIKKGKALKKKINLQKLLDVLTGIMKQIDPFAVKIGKQVHEVVLRTITCLLVLNDKQQIKSLEFLQFLKSIQYLDIKYPGLSKKYTPGILLLLCQLWEKQSLILNFKYFSRLIIYQLGTLEKHKQMQLIFGCISQLMTIPQIKLLIAHSKALVHSICVYPSGILQQTSQLHCCYLQALRIIKQICLIEQSHSSLVSSKFVDSAIEEISKFPNFFQPHKQDTDSLHRHSTHQFKQPKLEQTSFTDQTISHILLANTYLISIMNLLNKGPKRDQTYIPKSLINDNILKLQKNIQQWNEKDTLIFYAIQFLFSLHFKRNFNFDSNTRQVVTDTLARLFIGEMKMKKKQTTIEIGEAFLKLISRIDMSQNSKNKFLYLLPEQTQHLSKQQIQLTLNLLIQSKAVLSCSDDSLILKVVKLYQTHIVMLTKQVDSSFILKSLKFLLQIILKVPDIIQRDGDCLMYCVKYYSQVTRYLAAKPHKLQEQNQIIETFISIYKSYFLDIYKMKQFSEPITQAVQLCIYLMKQNFFSNSVADLIIQSISHSDIAPLIFEKGNIEIFFQKFTQHYTIDPSYHTMMDKIILCSKIPLKLYFLAQIRKVFLDSTNSASNLLSILTRIYDSQKNISNFGGESNKSVKKGVVQRVYSQFSQQRKQVNNVQGENFQQVQQNSILRQSRVQQENDSFMNMKNQFYEISLGLASELLKKMGCDRIRFLNKIMLFQIIDYGDINQKIRFLTRGLQLLGATCISIFNKNQMIQQEFFRLFFIILEKLDKVPNLYENQLFNNNSELRFSFAYQNHVSKTKQFMLLIESKLVLLIHQLTKYDDKLQNICETAYGRSLLLKIGRHYLKTKQEKEAFIFLKSFKGILQNQQNINQLQGFTNKNYKKIGRQNSNISNSPIHNNENDCSLQQTQLKERILILNEIISIVYQKEDSKSSLLRLCFQTFGELFKNESQLDFIEYKILQKIATVWSNKNEPELIEISLRAGQLCETMNQFQHKVDQSQLNAKVGAMVQNLKYQAELLESGGNQVFPIEQQKKQLNFLNLKNDKMYDESGASSKITSNRSSKNQFNKQGCQALKQIKTYMMNSKFKLEFQKEENISILAPALLCFIRKLDSDNIKIILEILLENSQEQNLLLEKMLSLNALTFFCGMEQRKSMILLIKLLTNISHMQNKGGKSSHPFQRYLVKQEVFIFLGKILQNESFGKLVSHFLLKLSKIDQFHQLMLKIGFSKLIHQLISVVVNEDVRDVVETISLIYGNLFKNKSEKVVSIVYDESRLIINDCLCTQRKDQNGVIMINQNTQISYQVLGSFILFLSLMNYQRLKIIDAKVVKQIFENFKFTTDVDQNILLKQYSCLCLLQLFDAKDDPNQAIETKQLAYKERINLTIFALLESQKPIIDVQIKKGLMVMLKKQQPLLREISNEEKLQEGVKLIQILIDAILNDRTERQIDFLVILSKEITELHLSQMNPQLLSQFIKKVKQLFIDMNVFQIFKNIIIKNNEQQQVEAINTQTTLFIFRILFSFHQISPEQFQDFQNIYMQIIHSFLDLNSPIPLQIFQKIAYFYFNSIDTYKEDEKLQFTLNDVILFIRHPPTQKKQQILQKCYITSQANFHHLAALLIRITNEMLLKQKVSVQIDILKNLSQSYLILLEHLRTDFQKNQPSTNKISDCQIEVFSGIIQNLLQISKLGMKIQNDITFNLQSLMHGTIAALAIFQIDESVVITSYELMKITLDKILKNEEQIEKYAPIVEARLVELASISFKHIVSYCCEKALEFLFTLLEYILAKKNKVPAPFVLMLTKLNERLNNSEIKQALMELKIGGK